MKKMESKKFTIAVLVYCLLTAMIASAWIIAKIHPIQSVPGDYVQAMQSIGMVLAGGLVSYFITQGYIDGKREDGKNEKNHP